MSNYLDQFGYYKRIELDDNNYLYTSTNPEQQEEVITALGKINKTAFFVEVNEGNISGTTPFSKFGRNPDIDTGAVEDIWNGGGLYTGFPVETETLEILSTSINDTAGGTGAITVEISNLLDATFNEMPPIIVTLNGTTPVSLGAQTYHRASRIRTLTAGSSNWNEGNLILRHTTTTANVFAVMPATLNQTQIFAYSVPLGKTLYIPNFSVMMTRANGSAGSANVTVKIKNGISNVWNVVRNVDISDSQSYQYHSGAYFVVNEGMDVKATIESVSDNNTVVTGEADGFLIDNV